MPRIIMPTKDEKGLKTQISLHFGRTPYFTIVDLNEDKEVIKITTTPNTGEHYGGRSNPHDLIQEYRPDAIVVHGMGPRGLQHFRHGGITVFKAQGNTAKEIISAYITNRLQELTTGCHQARHQ